jgi:hypothetical protein
MRRPDGHRLTNALDRRLAALGRVYASLFRVDHYDLDLLEPEWTVSAQQAREMLKSAFQRNFVEDLGHKASLRMLRELTRTFFVTRYALRSTLLLSLPVLVQVHGLRVGMAAQTLLYLSSRPLALINRGRGVRIAEQILHNAVRPSAGSVRRVLGSALGSIPARALMSRRWADHLLPLLPKDETTREIVVKLADQYDGDIAALIETSRELAR